MDDRLILVVNLWPVPGEEAAFEAFERDAARVMARHGGRLERVLRVEAGEAGSPSEVHVVSFPDRESFAAYRDDEEARRLAPRREACIARTEVLIARDAPPY